MEIRHTFLIYTRLILTCVSDDLPDGVSVFLLSSAVREVFCIVWSELVEKTFSVVLIFLTRS